MYVGSPALPLSIKLEEAVKRIEEILKKKRWHDFSVGELKLVYEPFFAFDFDTLKNTEVVSAGSSAFSPLTGGFDAKAAESFKAKIKHATHKLPAEYPIELKKIELSDENAQFIILETLLRGGQEQQKNFSFSVSGIQKFYLPRWKAFITIGEAHYGVTVNGTSGEIDGLDAVPMHEKGFVEITKETLEELKRPNAWLRYSKELVDEARMLVYTPKPQDASQAMPKEGLLSLFTGSNLTISLILIAVIVLVFYFL